MHDSITNHRSNNRISSWASLKSLVGVTMMDMETVIPRTCSMCYGSGIAMWYLDDDTFETRECECQYKEENNG